MKAELLSAWGSDIDVVNNARVSFHKETEAIYRCIACGTPSTGNGVCECGNGVFKPGLSDPDKRLIGYLARGCTLGDWEEMVLELSATGEEDRIIEILIHVKRMPEHWAPFANGCGMRFRIKAPIPIMRQVFKHKIGSVENEVSRRYVSYEPEVFDPFWRYAPEGSIKQGSGEALVSDSGAADLIYRQSVELALVAYEDLLALGVAPEQARFVLPQGVYTEAIVSNSLYGWARFYNQRSDRAHAQQEIADLADQIGEEAARRFPVSWNALTK